MSLADEVKIRRLRGPDCHAVFTFVSELQRNRQRDEIRKEIKKMFLHPSIWILCAVLISTMGLYFNVPPIPASCGVLLLTWTWSKFRFQSYWSRVRKIFRMEGEDWHDLYKFYCLTKRKRLFLIAEIGQRIVGTCAIREAPGMPEIAQTCKAWRIFVTHEFRRHGIGSKLIVESMKAASEMGYNRMAVQTFDDKTELYRKLGFKLTSKDVVASSYPLRFIAYNYEKYDLKGNEEILSKKDV